MSGGPVIYALVDPADGLPRYVGASRRFAHRIRAHRAFAKRLTQAPKYDVEKWERRLFLEGRSFDWKILEETTEADIDAAESFWISQGRGLGWPLTNETSGGRGASGFRHDAESREKMRTQPRATGPRGPNPWSAEARARYAEFRRMWTVPLIDDLGRMYASADEAARLLNVRTDTVKHHLGGKPKTVSGRVLRRLPR